MVHNEKLSSFSKLHMIGIFNAIAYFTLWPYLQKLMWPKLLALFGDIRIFHLFYLLIISTFAFFGGVIVISYISKQKIQFFEQFRIQNKPWPWEVDQVTWNKMFRKSLINVLFNLYIVGATCAIIDSFYFTLEIQYEYEQFPSLLEIFIQVFLCINIHEFWFYWIHRIGHHRLIYPYIHKVHHQYYQNVTIAGQYFHPFDYFQSIILSGVFGRRLLCGNIHFVSFSMWIGIMNFSAMDDHCGYEFPWSPLSWSRFFVGPQYHDYHHSHNIGCYAATLSYLDYLCGTNKEYLEYIKTKIDQKKQKLK